MICLLEVNTFNIYQIPESLTANLKLPQSIPFYYFCSCVINIGEY